MSQHYSDPSREGETWALPDVEVFYAAAHEFVAAWKGNDGTWMADEMRRHHEDAIAGGYEFDADDSAALFAGWYYWYCFPGCMPDSDAMGPYASEADAVEAALEE